MRLRAIREYTAEYACNCKPMSTSTRYCVTFAREDGIVVAECSFYSKDEADMVVDAVNEKYDKLGKWGNHCSEWENHYVPQKEEDKAD